MFTFDSRNYDPMVVRRKLGDINTLLRAISESKDEQSRLYAIGEAVRPIRAAFDLPPLSHDGAGFTEEYCMQIMSEFSDGLRGKK